MVNVPRRIALTVCLTVLAGSASAQNSVPGMLAAAKAKSLCYSVSLDRAAAKGAPKRHVRSMLVSLQAGKHDSVLLRARLIIAGRKVPGDVGASCVWSENANVYSTGAMVDKAFGKKSGFSCIAAYSGPSAEEAGSLLFDFSRNGRSLALHFSESIGWWQATNPDLKKRGIDLDASDRIFRLDRMSEAACARLNADVKLDF